MKSKLIFVNPTSGKPVDIPGVWDGSLFVPDVLSEEFQANPSWPQIAKEMASWFPDSPLIVSSVRSDMFGKPRKPTSTHARGLSLDLAPTYSKTSALHPQLISPRIADKRAIAAFVACHANKVPCGIVLEGDHFHIDARYPSGCYLYSTYRTEYVNDSVNRWLAKSPLNKTMFIAHPNGEITLFSDFERVEIERPFSQ
jgi:hypothetical protein